MSLDNQQNPKVSVSIPSYNHARYIRKTIESIFAQTYQNLQLIIVDDGSTDDSAKIIEQTFKNSPFECELIVRPNKGPAATATEAIERADGEFHACISSDDMWLPDFIKSRVNQLQNRPDALLAYGHAYYIDENDNIIGSTTDWAQYDDGNVRDMLLTRYPPYIQTVLFRKSVLDAHKFNPQNFTDDFDLFLRLCTLGEFAFEPSVLSAYRMHTTNISKKTQSILDGKIQAYRSNAANLGLTAEETEEIIDKIRWQTIDFFLNSERRIDAIKLAMQLSHVKIPLTAKLKQYLKLLLPRMIIEIGRKSIKRNKKWENTDIKQMIFEQTKDSNKGNLSIN